MKKQSTVLLIILALATSHLQAQKLDTLIKKLHFELSFGQSLLFISNSKQINIRNEAAIIVPTNAILFFIELRPQKRMRIPVFLNVPTEAKQFLVNGQLIYERASPTFGSGLVFKLFQIKIDEKSKMDFEIGPLASIIADKNNVLRVAPVIAGRIRIMRGENFVMYFGGSYSFGINAFGILYGTGTIF